MAAIDKLYVRTYEDYDDLRRWALAYYPKLLLYFYDISLTKKQYHDNRRGWVVNAKRGIELSHKRLGDYKTQEEAIQNLIKYYKEVSDYDCPYEQAKDEVLCDTIDMAMTNDEIKETYMFPIMNTPLSVDRKLKWICPVPCVREYLHKQCGVNPKWEWLYKIFWRGKKYFKY